MSHISSQKVVFLKIKYLINSYSLFPNLIENKRKYFWFVKQLYCKYDGYGEFSNMVQLRDIWKHWYLSSYFLISFHNLKFFSSCCVVKTPVIKPNVKRIRHMLQTLKFLPAGYYTIYLHTECISIKSFQYNIASILYQTAILKHLDWT